MTAKDFQKYCQERGNDSCLECQYHKKCSKICNEIRGKNGADGVDDALWAILMVQSFRKEKLEKLLDN